jgi:GDPmannose 4,6-dehydratase
MLQHEAGDDFVVATGDSHSVEDFLEECFSYVALDWRKHVKIEPRFYRPAEVDALEGDASKAERALGWRPKVTFRDLARMMVDADLELARRERGGASR